MSPTGKSLPTTSSAASKGAGLRICIVRARWNAEVIAALVDGCRKTLLEGGVKEEDIVEESVPGSWELPGACKSIIEGSKTLLPNIPALDLLTSASTTSLTNLTGSTPTTVNGKPYDAVIAIGVLIKGSTMHFEYISGSVSESLMKLGTELNTPIIFGVLTCLTDAQAEERAGISKTVEGGGHNHGFDWGSAAIEMGYKSKEWSKGKVVGTA